MPKKIKFESFKYRFLIAAQNTIFQSNNTEQPSWDEFVRSLKFSYEKGGVRIEWSFITPGILSVPLNEANFYFRGDSQQQVERQKTSGLLDSEDPVKLKNTAYFNEIVRHVAQSAGYKEVNKDKIMHGKRLENERVFHDAWADSEDIENINVRTANEACTAPEMRYIRQRLGDINGKRLLDVGCGLGEASVYFALLGADVTSSDLSQGMLDATCRLAETNGVSVTPHVASAEDMQLSQDALFDIIYAGNLLHHVDIEQTITRIKPHLAADGIFVTWDPLAYNPAINAYRAIATDVRTPDEHPLKWDDIKLFKKHFGTVETKYFWLTTLIIFLIMALVQRRNPNKERFWKTVVQEGDKWSWLYLPLEKLDRLILNIFPLLGLLCWNVVIVCKA
ncbi:MAG: methyltransferase domain-containing protein [Methylovulum sp.]|nr:methyltransferase domain-containing protein [Methylovulum sp.]